MTEDDSVLYQVLINHEEQYTIFYADREVPVYWKPVGKTGTRDECLAYIKEVWTDMRPLSIRKAMEQASDQ